MSEFGSLSPVDQAAAGLSMDELLQRVNALRGKIPQQENQPPNVIPSSGEIAPMPRNPARPPQAIEDLAYGMSVKPAMDIGMGVGSVVNGQGWSSPEVGAGLMGAMALMSPMKAGMLGPRTGIRAYHGSPYDFDRFDLSRIGTGEGAQSYGHGLYFAENPKTATRYREQLAADDFTNPLIAAGAYLRDFGTPEAAMAKMRDHLINGPGLKPNERTGVAQGLELLRSGAAIEPPPTPGKMYEVNINAKPEQFLDWDRPLNQQSQHVQGPLRAIVKNPKMDWSQEGSQFIRELGHDPQNSEIMNRHGIPGIRYLDQGSRSEGAGTSNYVLFNDKIIDIMKKWGLVGGMAGAGAADQGFGSLTPPDQHQ